MQPNQQYDNNSQGQQPAPNGYVSPTGANVPEYLHMEPVADPVVTTQKRKKKKLIVLVTALLLAILTVTGAAVYWYMQYNDPQARLYRALEKQMQISYMSRMYDTKDSVSSENEIKSSYKAETDLSDPVNPKSRGSFTESGYVNGNKSDQYTISTEEIMTKFPTSVFRFTNQTSASVVRPLRTTGKWYEYSYLLNKNDTSRKEIQYDLDGQIDLSEINSVQGIVLSGNLSSGQRDSLMAYIKKNKTYPIVDSQTISIDGSAAMQYTIKIDRKKINELNNEAKSLLGLQYFLKLSTDSSPDESLRLLVDNKTDKIVKIVYSYAYPYSDRKFERSMTLGYPSALSIAEPSGVDYVAGSK